VHKKKDTCAGAVLFLKELMKACPANPRTSVRSPATCGTDSCLKMVRSIDDAAISDTKTGIFACYDTRSQVFNYYDDNNKYIIVDNGVVSETKTGIFACYDTRSLKNTQTRAYTHTHTHTHYMYLHIHTFIYTYTIYLYTHTHTHTHTHTQCIYIYIHERQDSCSKPLFCNPFS